MTSKGIILAVDDAPGSLWLLTEILTAEGYDVRPADNGELALAAVTASKPELILLDIRMAGMDGFEVCRRLKEKSDTRDIPVMFISAVTDTRDRVAGLNVGAVDFLSKPFQKEELLARIRTHLELSRLRNRSEEMVAERTANLKASNEQLRLELTERVRAEQALRESEERFRTMADNAPVVIWTCGPDNKINFVNRYALTLTGRTLEELTGGYGEEVVHPEDLEHKLPKYVPMIAARRECRIEYRARAADGEYRWMLATVIPRFLADDSFAGYIGIAVDITDLKHNQEQLLATQKLESLGIMVSGIAHNFNNLVGAIIAEADLALSELPPDSPAHGNVEQINAIAMRAADIVYVLTAYASFGPAGEVMSLDFSSVVEEALQLVKATVSRNIAFSVTLDRKLPAIRADVSQIRQIVVNLLTNACESLPNQQGSVNVNTSCVHICADTAEKDLISLPAGDYVQLCVTDSGCGIPAEVQGKIFDPFFTKKFPGRGLGLAAVQGIVRSLGGIVTVQSTIERGSTFEVLLPAVDCGAHAAADHGPSDT